MIIAIVALLLIVCVIFTANKYYSYKSYTFNQINNLKKQLDYSRTEYKKIAQEYKQLNIKYNELDNKLTNSYTESAVVQSVRQLYKQMFSTVYKENPKLINDFFSTIINSGFTFPAHKDLSNNVYDPYIILKECISFSMEEDTNNINLKMKLKTNINDSQVQYCSNNSLNLRALSLIQNHDEILDLVTQTFTSQLKNITETVIAKTINN